jgi:hypothetical protein
VDGVSAGPEAGHGLGQHELEQRHLLGVLPHLYINIHCNKHTCINIYIYVFKHTYIYIHI